MIKIVIVYSPLQYVNPNLSAVIFDFDWGVNKNNEFSVFGEL